MSKPECDHRAIDPSLKEFHGHGVAQHMRCHFLPKQRRAGLGSGHNVLCKDVSHAITAETIAPSVGKSISVCALWGSFNQFFNTALVCLVSGVHLSFRLFPVQRTCAPVYTMTDCL